MSYPNAFNLPIGALVKMSCVDDKQSDGMYGAYGVVVGTCMYTGYMDEHDSQGDRCYGYETLPADGYTLCMVTGGMWLEHSLQKVSQRFVSLVKPGDVERHLESHIKYVHDRVSGFDKVKFQLEQLVERERYARKYSSTWDHLYKGIEYPGELEEEIKDKRSAVERVKKEHERVG